MSKCRWLIPIVALFGLAFFLIPIASADTTYVVKPGENLFRIALNHGLSTQQLAEANGILNPAHIYAGQVLVIPDDNVTSAPAAPAAAPEPEQSASASAGTYVIQRGDTLFRIAVRFGVSTSTLAQANGIVNPSYIYAGQTLTIPAGASTGGAASGATPAASSPPPVASAGAGERWIDVNLSTQSLTAFEGNTPVYSALISSGTWAHPTVTGQFRVYIRYELQDMDGRYLGFNYYLPNVPYVMYFYKGYALHGTYWHSNFGTPMSHGCVNLTIPDAQWIYNWSTYGTLVNVHY
jgi:LysM repeat protein